MCSGVASLPICPAADPEPIDGSPLKRVRKIKKEEEAERCRKESKIGRLSEDKKRRVYQEEKYEAEEEKAWFSSTQVKESPPFFCEHRARQE